MCVYNNSVFIAFVVLLFVINICVINGSARNSYHCETNVLFGCCTDVPKNASWHFGCTRLKYVFPLSKMMGEVVGWAERALKA